MVNRRPDPKVLKRKLLDIELRYNAHSRDVRVSHRSRGMAAIRLAEMTRWLNDTYGKGVELEYKDMLIVLIFVHHLGALKDAARRINDWVRTYAPWISPHDLERMIGETQTRPMRWKADRLGWHLQLTEEQRSRLKIRTIGAKGINKDMRKAARRLKDAEQARLRRARAKATVGSI